jgi:hypothetical protein
VASQGEEDDASMKGGGGKPRFDAEEGEAVTEETVGGGEVEERVEVEEGLLVGPNGVDESVVEETASDVKDLVSQAKIRRGVL